MPTIKTSVLTGALLDWAVAIAEGKHAAASKEWGNAGINNLGRCSIAKLSWDCAKHFEPSKNWAHGGPIIERERILLFTAGDEWLAKVNLLASNLGAGPNPLVAAMRAYVASKLGDTLDIPIHIHKKPEAA